MDDLEQEIADARRHLGKLMEKAGRNAPLTDRSPRLSIPVSREMWEEFQSVARRNRTSVSALGQVAVKHLLIQARAGALPMLPRSTLENAQTITCLGNPLD